VICESESTDTSFPAVVPNSTPVAPVNPVPVIVTVVPPPLTPVRGLTRRMDETIFGGRLFVVVVAVVDDEGCVAVVVPLVVVAVVVPPVVEVTVEVEVEVDLVEIAVLVLPVEVDPVAGAKYHAAPLGL